MEVAKDFEEVNLNENSEFQKCENPIKTESKLLEKIRIYKGISIPIIIYIILTCLSLTIASIFIIINNV